MPAVPPPSIASSPAASPAGFAEGPRLLADIGGTNARFALETAPMCFAAIEVLPCAAHASIGDAVRAYLGGAAARAITQAVPRHAAVAIANPVEGDLVRMTNHHWQFSIAAVRDELGLATLEVLNDFAALAMALPHLGDGQRRQVGGGQAQARRPLGLVGAGTGLGVAGVTPAADGQWLALPSEGGHASFAPADEVEMDILRFAWREFAHVSAERFVSGPGLELVYRALAARAGLGDARLPAAEITGRALAASDALCHEAVMRFCGMLGGVAGNLALTLCATGGVYIGGGIVPRLGALFDASPFRARFEAKGRFAGYLAQVPTWVITEAYPAFYGVSAALRAKLGA